jgi:hypothetical protein
MYSSVFFSFISRRFSTSALSPSDFQGFPSKPHSVFRAGKLLTYTQEARSSNLGWNVIISVMSLDMWNTRWRSRLRHCATCRKVTGSIPDGFIGIFPSGRTMALGLTQPLTELSTRNISLGVKMAGA